MAVESCRATSTTPELTEAERLRRHGDDLYSAAASIERLYDEHSQLTAEVARLKREKEQLLRHGRVEER